jgi:bis(5'-nucleosyl)-tetraphosphatase (symmetrical)
MATYAIGDVQGCYDELNHLLEHIQFEPNQDRLWFTGDLVNRGPDSLSVLRFVKGLGTVAITVLGNHDLHLLALAYSANPQPRKGDTLAAVLCATDRDELIDWLCNCPLIHNDISCGYTLVHAGLPPQWDLPQAQQRADEITSVLRQGDRKGFLHHMYGNFPDRWSDDLQGWDRLRFITNGFTRMRYCDANGRLDLHDKGSPGTQAEDLMPWFMLPHRRNREQKILFGHWASLRMTQIEMAQYHCYALDSGCVWGDRLTAYRLEDGQFFSVSSTQ